MSSDRVRSFAPTASDRVRSFAPPRRTGSADAVGPGPQRCRHGPPPRTGSAKPCRSDRTDRMPSGTLGQRSEYMERPMVVPWKEGRHATRRARLSGDVEGLRAVTERAEGASGDVVAIVPVAESPVRVDLHPEVTAPISNPAVDSFRTLRRDSSQPSHTIRHIESAAHPCTCDPVPERGRLLPSRLSCRSVSGSVLTHPHDVPRRARA